MSTRLIITVLFLITYPSVGLSGESPWKAHNDAIEQTKLDTLISIEKARKSLIAELKVSYKAKFANKEFDEAAEIRSSIFYLEAEMENIDAAVQRKKGFCLVDIQLNPTPFVPSGTSFLSSQFFVETTDNEPARYWTFNSSLSFENAAFYDDDKFGSYTLSVNDNANNVSLVPKIRSRTITCYKLITDNEKASRQLVRYSGVFRVINNEMYVLWTSKASNSNTEYIDEIETVKLRNDKQATLKPIKQEEFLKATSSTAKE